MLKVVKKNNQGKPKPVTQFFMNGKLVLIDFAHINGNGSIRYSITVNGRVTHNNLFPEEVIRWMSKVITEKGVDG